VCSLALVLTWDGPSTIKKPLQQLQSFHPRMRPIRILRYVKVNKSSPTPSLLVISIKTWSFKFKLPLCMIYALIWV
jgi:hypothetical protein